MTTLDSYSNSPNNYVCCIHQEFPMSETCLRQLSYKYISEERSSVLILPQTKITLDNTCEYFQYGKPIMCVRGFKKILSHLTIQQLQSFRELLMNQFTKRAYYGLRNGTYAILPHQQQFIKNTLLNIGFNSNIDFDSYENLIVWQ